MSDVRGYDFILDARMDAEFARQELESERAEVVNEIAGQIVRSGLIREAAIYCMFLQLNYDPEIISAARTMCEWGVIEFYQDDKRVPLIARVKRILSLADDMTRHNAPLDVLWDDNENYLPHTEPFLAVQLAEKILSYRERNSW